MRRHDPGVPSALQILEEAFHLLRRATPHELLWFYAASVPFVVDLLFFVADRTRTGAPGAMPALRLGGLYVATKVGQGELARRLRARLGPAAAPAGWRHAAVQVESQPWSLVALPAAFVLGFPFGWVYAYVQALAVTGDRAAARRHAAAWPGQNHALLCLLALIAGVLFLNLWVLLLVLPGLLHALVGWQGAAALHPFGMLSSTTVEVAAALAYLASAPLARAAYAVRCFYRDARATGDDLRGALAACRAPLAAGAGALALGLTLALGASAAAADAGPPAAGWTARAPALDAAAQRVLARREFAWRLPVPPAAQPQGLFARLVEPLVEVTTKMVTALRDALRAVLDWVARVLRLRTPPRATHDAPGFGWIGWTQLWFGLAAALVVAAAVLLLRRRRRPAPVAAATPAAAETPLDVETDEASAARLPAEQWLATARRLLAAGDARAAVRAAYLAGLAILAQRELVTPARAKSNREYLRELLRRTRERPEVAGLFEESMRTFERVWYGRHEATAELAGATLAAVERLPGALPAPPAGGALAR